MALGQTELKVIASAIQEANLDWVSGETETTTLSKEEFDIRLGFTPGPGDPSLEDSEAAARLTLEVESSASSAHDEGFGAPISSDLRNQGGKNFITPIRNQGGCGSCVAFGSVATMEGTARKRANDPSLAVDYSEAQLFFCHARSEGRNCGNGWWSGKAMDALKSKGVVDDACYRYVARDQNCTGLCSDAASRITKITGWKRLTTRAAMKDWLHTKGPLNACYTVYADFSSYRSGVYRHVSGARRGGHCVSTVGYNDSGGYWICKNSWGAGWGESGFFRIAYGEVGIDDYMDGIEGVQFIGWNRNKRVTALFCTNETRNAWVSIAGMGWKKVANNNDNIFFDMLSQLAAAKTGNRRVDFKEDDGKITQAYVL